jgi:hypothetical protein
MIEILQNKFLKVMAKIRVVHVIALHPVYFHLLSHSLIIRQVSNTNIIIIKYVGMYKKSGRS